MTGSGKGGRPGCLDAFGDRIGDRLLGIDRVGRRRFGLARPDVHGPTHRLIGHDRDGVGGPDQPVARDRALRRRDQWHGHEQAGGDHPSDGLRHAETADVGERHAAVADHVDDLGDHRQDDDDDRGPDDDQRQPDHDIGDRVVAQSVGQRRTDPIEVPVGRRRDAVERRSAAEARPRDLQQHEWDADRDDRQQHDGAQERQRLRSSAPHHRGTSSLLTAADSGHALTGVGARHRPQGKAVRLVIPGRPPARPRRRP